jgi:PAS domain S-box-containing protein
MTDFISGTFTNPDTYLTTSQLKTTHLQGIADIAAHICGCSLGAVSMLNREGQLIHLTNGIDEVHEIPAALHSEMHVPGEVYQLTIADEIPEGHAGEPTASMNRFYGVVPLILPNGKSIGVLWVSDKAPKVLNEQQKSSFLLLGTQLLAYLEVEQKNNELEHAKVELEKFNDLFNYSNEVHCMMDAEGKIIYVNNSIHDLLGYLPAEVMNKTIWEFCVPGQRDRSMPIIETEMRAGKDRFQIQTKTITKSGKLRWFEWSNVIREGNWLVNGRDITRRKQAELRTQVLTLAVEKSSAGVFIRNVNSEITWMNEAMEDLIGYTFKELKGKTFAKILLGKDSDMSVFDHAIKKSMAQESYKVEIKCYKKDGTPVWLFISNTPAFNEFNELERYVGVAFDITDRKLAEAQLIKTREDAINLSLAKENFLSVMSHELRTPLNGVIGASRLLAEEEHFEHQEETLDILQFSAQNLLSLINDVLDFTKIETGNMLLESERLNLKSLVDKTIHSFRPRAHEQGIKLSYAFDDRIPGYVYGDHTRLYQILVNLTGNAVKFTSEGEVKIEISLEEEREAETVIKFQIQDSGIGIATDKLDAIFDAYMQAGSDTSRKYGGTGLGLAITKKLVELYGSSIGVTSTLGKGTCFFFTIAFKKCDSSNDHMPDCPTVQEDLKGHVLVVDV